LDDNRILIADDDKSIRWVLSETARKKGFDVDEAENGKEALEKILTNEYLLIFIDIRMPQIDGLTVMEKAIKSLHSPRFIVMTAVKSPEPAAKAASLGVMEYITKPFDLDEIEKILDQSIDESNARGTGTKGADIGEDYLYQEKIVGTSKPIIDLYKQIGKISKTDITVLLTGERGTGKELVARTIHDLSPVDQKKFVAVNMAAIPQEMVEAEIFGFEKGAFTGSVTSKPGMIEAASGGSLFLDEIGDTPLHLQAKLLRFIQEKEFYRLGSNALKVFHGRIITATNKNLEELVNEGKFRSDLFDRLNVYQMYIPPLRERKDDIPLLARYMTKKYSLLLTNTEKSLTEEAISELGKYEWPGNVRELENLIMKVCINAKEDGITDRDLLQFLLPDKGFTQFAEKVIQDLSLEKLVELKTKGFVEQMGHEIESETDLWEMFMNQVERPLIKTILKATKGNKIKASKILGINRNTLHNRIEKLKIGKRKPAKKGKR
jgi:two-component system nitrogen regulation response regulator GlnG